MGRGQRVAQQVPAVTTSSTPERIEEHQSGQGLHLEEAGEHELASHSCPSWKRALPHPPNSADVTFVLGEYSTRPVSTD